MNNQYLTKTELIQRWNRELVETYFPYCSKVMTNPKNKRYPLMQLYDINRVRRIEATERFKGDILKVIERKLKIREARKRNKAQATVSA